MTRGFLEIDHKNLSGVLISLPTWS